MPSNRDHYDCLILGSGIAGYSAVEGFRKYAVAKTVAIMTPETGELYSPCALPHFVSGRMARDQIFLKNRFDLEKLGVKVLSHTCAVRLDPANQIVHSEGRHAGIVHYDQLVLATGSYPLFPICGPERLTGLFTFKSFSDAQNVKHYPAGKAVVVGSGLIGVEAAASLVERGIHVTLIEARPHILPALLDSQPAELMRKALEGRGLTVRTEECVKAIVGDGAVESVATTRLELPAELVVMAIGMKPNTELAGSAGLALGSTGGIWVDNFLKTSAPNIYACGDCVESRDFIFDQPVLNLFWYVAKTQGWAAGANAAGQMLAYRPYPRMVSAEIFRIPICSLGFTEEELGCMNLKVETHVKLESGHLIKTLYHKDRLVGLQMINDKRNLPYLIPSSHMGSIKKDLRNISSAQISAHLGRMFRFGFPVDNPKNI